MRPEYEPQRRGRMDVLIEQRRVTLKPAGRENCDWSGKCFNAIIFFVENVSAETTIFDFWPLTFDL